MFCATGGALATWEAQQTAHSKSQLVCLLGVQGLSCQDLSLLTGCSGCRMRAAATTSTLSRLSTAHHRSASCLFRAGSTAATPHSLPHLCPARCWWVARLFHHRVQGSSTPESCGCTVTLLGCCLAPPPLFLLQVAEAIASAVERGLTIPIMYNTSSYDALSSLSLMDGLVDIVGPLHTHCGCLVCHIVCAPCHAHSSRLCLPST